MHALIVKGISDCGSSECMLFKSPPHNPMDAIQDFLRGYPEHVQSALEDWATALNVTGASTLHYIFDAASSFARSLSLPDAGVQDLWRSMRADGSAWADFRRREREEASPPQWASVCCLLRTRRCPQRRSHPSGVSHPWRTPGPHGRASSPKKALPPPGLPRQRRPPTLPRARE